LIVWRPGFVLVWRLEELGYPVRVEEVISGEGGDAFERDGDTLGLVEDFQQDTSNERGDDLETDRLGIPGHHPLDLQILPDPLEEQFDLPAAFVNGSDGLCWQIEVICQEDQALSSLGIKELIRLSFLGSSRLLCKCATEWFDRSADHWTCRLDETYTG